MAAGKPLPAAASLIRVACSTLRIGSLLEGAHAMFPVTFDPTHFCLLTVMTHAALLNYRFRPSKRVVALPPPPSSVELTSQQQRDASANVSRFATLGDILLSGAAALPSGALDCGPFDAAHKFYVSTLARAHHNLSKMVRVLYAQGLSKFQRIQHQATMRLAETPLDLGDLAGLVAAAAAAPSTVTALAAASTSSGSSRNQAATGSRPRATLISLRGRLGDTFNAQTAAAQICLDINLIAGQVFHLWHGLLRMLRYADAFAGSLLFKRWADQSKERWGQFVFRESLKVSQRAHTAAADASTNASHFAALIRDRISSAGSVAQYSASASGSMSMPAPISVPALPLENVRMQYAPSSAAIFIEQSFNRRSPLASTPLAASHAKAEAIDLSSIDIFAPPPPSPAIRQGALMPSHGVASAASQIIDASHEIIAEPTPDEPAWSPPVAPAEAAANGQAAASAASAANAATAPVEPPLFVSPEFAFILQTPPQRYSDFSPLPLPLPPSLLLASASASPLNSIHSPTLSASKHQHQSAAAGGGKDSVNRAAAGDGGEGQGPCPGRYDEIHRRWASNAGESIAVTIRPTQSMSPCALPSTAASLSSSSSFTAAISTSEIDAQLPQAAATPVSFFGALASASASVTAALEAAVEVPSSADAIAVRFNGSVDSQSSPNELLEHLSFATHAIDSASSEPAPVSILGMLAAASAQSAAALEEVSWKTPDQTAPLPLMAPAAVKDSALPPKSDCGGSHSSPSPASSGQFMSVLHPADCALTTSVTASATGVSLMVHSIPLSSTSSISPLLCPVPGGGFSPDKVVQPPPESARASASPVHCGAAALANSFTFELPATSSTQPARWPLALLVPTIPSSSSPLMPSNASSSASDTIASTLNAILPWVHSTSFGLFHSQQHRALDDSIAAFDSQRISGEYGHASYSSAALPPSATPVSATAAPSDALLPVSFGAALSAPLFPAFEHFASSASPSSPPAPLTEADPLHFISKLDLRACVAAVLQSLQFQRIQSERRSLQMVESSFSSTRGLIPLEIASPSDVPTLSDGDEPESSNASSSSFPAAASVASRRINAAAIGARNVFSELLLTLPQLRQFFSMRTLLQGPSTDESDPSSISPHFAAVRKLRFPGRHLFVLVHGYQGNSWDMRLLRNVLAVFHPEARFHCSTVNEGLTEGDIDAMGRRLADEVDAQVSEAGVGVGGDHDVTRISFIGHSLGGLIIRAAFTAPAMSAHLAKLHTLVTLASPFCGYLFNQSRLLTSGLYVMQRMFGSSCLLQLSLQDHADPRETFVYRLAHRPGLQLFRNVVLLSSPEDQYVPYHSARIEHCPAAAADPVWGPIYAEMVDALLGPTATADASVNFTRLDVSFVKHHHGRIDAFIGRAAHISFLDQEPFIWQFVAMCKRFFE